jgi:hypothetical protein
LDVGQGHVFCLQGKGCVHGDFFQS